MRNIKICTLLLGGFLLCASACGGGGASLSPDSSPSSGGQKVNCEVAGVEFGVSEISDVDAYAAEVTDGAVSHDAPLQNGMIVSPYYTLTVGGKEVPVYATRCAKSVHSFAYADISKTDKTKDFEVDGAAFLYGAFQIEAVRGGAAPKKGRGSGNFGRYGDGAHFRFRQLHLRVQ